jgi:hypothetical protein
MYGCNYSITIKKISIMKSTNWIIVVSLVSFFVLVSGCKTDSSKSADLEDAIDKEIAGEDELMDDDYVEKSKFIFYNMYSPIEMAGIFHDAGAIYTPEILNPVINIDRYSTSYKAAMNLGIYGVDLSYARMFDQMQVSIEYLNAIQQMADILGIPPDFVSLTAAKVEKYSGDRDSIIQVATEAYANTDIYLKSGKRESTAALVVFGGWIESMYVATNIFNPGEPDQAIMERIAEQKYSLNSLIVLLSNFQEDINISEYLVLLRKLKRIFDTFEIYYEPGDFDIDTVNKVIALNRNKIDVSSSQVLQIKSIVKEIRGKMIE